MSSNQLSPEMQALLASMVQAQRDELAVAIETGRLEDGSHLTEQQKEDAMQIVMLWDSLYGQSEQEPFKVLKGGELIRTADKDNKNQQQDKQDIKIRWQ